MKSTIFVLGAALAVVLVSGICMAADEGATFGYWQQPLKIEGDLDAAAREKATLAAEAKRRASLLLAEPRTAAETNQLGYVMGAALRFLVSRRLKDEADAFMAEVEKRPVLKQAAGGDAGLDIHRFNMLTYSGDFALREELKTRLLGYGPNVEVFKTLLVAHAIPADKALDYYKTLEAAGKGNQVRQALLANARGQDKALFADIFAQELAENPRTGFSPCDLACALIAAGRLDEVPAACKVLETNVAAKVQLRVKAHVLQAFATSADNPSAFRKKLEKIRAASDSFGTNGEPRVEADMRYFSALRATARDLYAVVPLRETKPMLEALRDYSCTLLHEEERVDYTVTFMRNAPKSAEGAYLGNVFEKLPKENRFGIYNVYSPWQESSEAKRLKSLPKPHLEADAEGYEGAFAAACDETGLHLYVKTGDPNAAETVAGITDNADFEVELQPGGEQSAHWQWGSALEPQNYWGVEWDTPHKGYKLTCDGLRADSFTGSDCHVFHIFAPWHLFYNSLPKNGDIWRVVLLAGTHGHAGTLGGGQVHELGRGARLTFKLSRNETEQLKLGLARQAAGVYKRTRGLWENAGFWADPHLGDPEFHDAVVKPFIEEMDTVADSIVKTPPSGAKLDKLLEEYIFPLADFGQALDAKRAAYLRDALFRQ